MTNRVAQACAAVPGATEDVASRALASFDGWAARQPVGAFREARRNRREHVRMRREAVDTAVENERKARKVGSGILAWVAWNLAAAAIRVLLTKLFEWWWNQRSQPRAAGDIEDRDNV